MLVIAIFLGVPSIWSGIERLKNPIHTLDDLPDIVRFLILGTPVFIGILEVVLIIVAIKEAVEAQRGALVTVTVLLSLGVSVWVTWSWHELGVALPSTAETVKIASRL
jgi:hypothetical protein